MATHTGPDSELEAITAVLDALRPLNEEQRKSVLEYVLRRFGAVPLQPTIVPSQVSAGGPSSSFSSIEGIQDIRTLRETKAPKSANEMAALVAYYVSELAPASERKPEINKTDVERYFKTAGFKLTAHAGQTLINAKNSGYLDTGSDTGYYKLNPVGYNLVVHRLPGGGRKQEKRRGATRKKKRARETR